MHLSDAAALQRGPRARMRKTMLDAAMRLMQDGVIPSISDVAQAAQVSRATAYRYFPTQSALIHAAVGEALGPILKWHSASEDAGERVSALIRFSYPRMDEYEAPLRAALRLALDQWARLHAGKLGDETPIVRGHRIGLLAAAVAPLRGELGKARTERLTQALSLVFGTEALVVLKDIWGLDCAAAQEVALWTCHALIRCAAEERAPDAVKRKVVPGGRSAAGGRGSAGRQRRRTGGAV
jgi:AcrR family transcriptional regulator